MPKDAKFSGGFEPGGRIFAVDGDFTVAEPCSAPEIYNPFPGDSVPSIYPIVILDRFVDEPEFKIVPIGEGFNVQDFNESQAAIVIEQDFMVAEAFHVPMRLNTKYDPLWGLGWKNTYTNLSSCFLVEEGPLISQGGGIVKFRRKFANLPPNRNEFESYGATFPALNFGTGSDKESFRVGFTEIVNSRIFYEYFVFDNLNLLSSIDAFPDGHRINTGTVAKNIRFLIIEKTKFFQGGFDDAIKNNQIIGPDSAITDGTPFDPTHPEQFIEPTIPNYSTYKTWQFQAEIVAESSSFTRWMGNIYVRRTRFVLAQ